MTLNKFDLALKRSACCNLLSLVQHLNLKFIDIQLSLKAEDIPSLGLKYIVEYNFDMNYKKMQCKTCFLKKLKLILLSSTQELHIKVDAKMLIKDDTKDHRILYNVE